MQNVSIYSSTTSPIVNVLVNEWATLLKQRSQYWYIVTHWSPQRTSGFFLGVGHSVHLYKSTMTLIHHYSIIQSSVTVLKPSVLCLCILPHPWHPHPSWSPVMFTFFTTAHGLFLISFSPCSSYHTGRHILHPTYTKLQQNLSICWLFSDLTTWHGYNDT